MKQPKTTNEHIISLYGYIKGLKSAISNIKNNDLYGKIMKSNLYHVGDLNGLKEVKNLFT